MCFEMKYIGYFLSVLASAAALSVSAADSLRVKPKHIAPPPAAQHWAAPTRMSLQGTADGVPDGLHMVGIDDKTVTLQWNSPEPTDGYYDDFEGHPDFVINSPGSVGGSILTWTMNRHIHGLRHRFLIRATRWHSSL